MTNPTKKGASIAEGSRDLTVLPRTRHAGGAKVSGCEFTIPSERTQPYRIGTVYFPLRPSGRSDNDGSLLVSAYRGIGSETVRCPVVITGHDPNIGDYRVDGSAQESPIRKLHEPRPMDAFGCLTTRKSNI